MSERVDLSTWWQNELQRDFTRLEAGLLGSFLTVIAIAFALVVWYLMI